MGDYPFHHIFLWLLSGLDFLFSQCLGWSFFSSYSFTWVVTCWSAEGVGESMDDYCASIKRSIDTKFWVPTSSMKSVCGLTLITLYGPFSLNMSLYRLEVANYYLFIDLRIYEASNCSGLSKEMKYPSFNVGKWRISLPKYFLYVARDIDDFLSVFVQMTVNRSKM